MTPALSGAELSKFSSLDTLAYLPGGRVPPADLEFLPPCGPDGRPAFAGHELLEEIGQGASAVVYRARHLLLGREVALKVLRAGPYAEEEERRRLRREAEVLARLQHPNVVALYGAGEHEECEFLSLELAGGGSLAGRANGAALPAREAAGLVATLARTLHHVHGRGVVHRDLKPANVLLTTGGVPKVADFGLARLCDVPEEAPSGGLLGTPTYAPPEQMDGRAAEAGPAADVYSLGAILYELLTGRPPFRGRNSWRTLRQVLLDAPAAPSVFQPLVPAELEGTCLRCLQKEPARRYATAATLAAALEDFLLAGGKRARRPGT